jgi:hypothetical protein
MPDMNGFDTARELAKLEPDTRHTHPNLRDVESRPAVRASRQLCRRQSEFAS